MNSSDLTNSTSIPTTATAETCRIWKEEYHKENYVFTLAAVILNIVTCPMTVCVNLLVIVAIKTKPRLQTIYNLLLCALAATDMVVGAVIQPSYVVGEMSLLTGSSLTEYCTQYTRVALLFLSPCIASLLLLALLSIERYLAMKYSLRYTDIITKGRVATAVITCWVIAVLPPVFLYSSTLPLLPLIIAVFIASGSLIVIFYCHISVYFVTRRHMIRIKSEQVSHDSKTKFLEEKKAAITTSIVVGFVLFSFLPSLVYRALRPLPLDNYFINLFISFKPVLLSSVLINSLCNPIIYCWRSSVLRKAFFELLGRKNSG